MKKVFSTLVLTVALLIALTSSSYALTLSPSSGTFPVSGNKTINLVSTTPSTAIKIRLIVTGAKIVSYSSPGGASLAIGVCDSNGSTTRSISSTKYEVCVDLGSTGAPISNGASLGTITVASLNSSGGNFTIEAGPQNGYSTTSGFQASIGALGNFSFGSGGNRVTTLPNTAISDYMPSRGLLGAAIMLSGVISLAVAIKIFLLDKRREIF